MTGKRSSAVFAGLLGSATVMAPGIAYAAAETASGPTSVVGSFALSLAVCALGAIAVACAGYGIYRLVDHIAHRHRGEAEPAGDQAGQDADEASYASREKDARPQSADSPEYGFDDDQTTGELVHEGKGGASGAFEPASQEDAGNPSAPYVPKHMAPQQPQEKGSRRKKQEEEELPQGKHAVGAERAEHAARGYEQIAQNYVEKQSFRKRMATRAQGVAAILSARIGENRMEGLPVIERADGSVGDVGTTWWTNAVGPNISGPLNIPEEEQQSLADLSIPESFDDLQFMASTAAETVAASPQAPAAARPAPASPHANSAREITQRVALVDEEAYPESRTVDEVDSDEWSQALAAMDEKISAPVASEVDEVPFEDAAGGVDSIDEPDDIEPNTQFMTFKPVGGHPEVVDNESYVNYLLAEELSHNSSEAVRSTSREYLHMIEGGTHASTAVLPSRHIRNRRGKKPDVYRPRHFAPADAEAYVEAMEA